MPDNARRKSTALSERNMDDIIIKSMEGRC